MANKNLKPKEEEVNTKLSYNPQGEESEVWKQYTKRKSELKMSRTNVNGLDIDDLMRRMDRQYFNREADIPASELDPKQKPISINNAFGKVQTALSILIDRNPDFQMSETLGKFSANRELMKSLIKSSWMKTNSLGQFKLSVFNAAKRGWFIGRTFNKKLQHKARFLTSIDKTGKRVYSEKMVTKMDDIAYVNLDNRNAWIDEEARPEDMYSARDGMHREVWHIDKVKQMFPVEEFPNMKFVTEGGDTDEVIGGTSEVGATGVTSARQNKRGMTEIYFYENQFDDWYIVEINGVMVVWEPLPQDNKRLSYTWGYWTLRSAEDIYGVGIVEMMEKNEDLIDRILNMTMRQLLISINPGGFYSGTEDMENENIKVEAGVFHRTLDPDKVKWLVVPGINQTPFDGMKYLEQKEEAITGINKIMEGDPTQSGNTNTAFELGLNKESSLKRLKLPLKSFQYALNWEFENRMSLIKQTYSDFKVRHLSDEKEIQDYLDEVEADPRFFFIENEGEAGQEQFYTKDYREAELNVDQDEKGNFIESENKKFFRILPEYLVYDCYITLDIDSMLVSSEELEKQNTLRLSNIIIPIITKVGYDNGVKPAKQILQAFNKDVNKWLPDEWIMKMKGKEKSSEESKEEQTILPNQEQDFGGMVPEKQLEGPADMNVNV